MTEINEIFTGNQNSRKNETTFGSLAELWLEDIRLHRKYSTYVKYRSIYHKYLLPLASAAFCSLDTERLLCLLSGVPMVDVSANTRYAVSMVMNQIIRYGNELLSCSMPSIRHANNPRKKSIEIFTHSEQFLLLQFLYAEPDPEKAGILICLLTGLRLGEICSLKWSDIDFHTRTLHVNSTIQRIAVTGYPTKTILYESTPKSESSMREIPLSDELIRLFHTLPHSGTYVLKGMRPMEPRTYENKLRRYLAKAHVPAKNFHALRHTFATNCIESGMDVKSLSEILGHADVQITLNRYVHPTFECKRTHMNQLADFYKMILK